MEAGKPVSEIAIAIDIGIRSIKPVLLKNCLFFFWVADEISGLSAPITRLIHR